MDYVAAEKDTNKLQMNYYSGVNDIDSEGWPLNGITTKNAYKYIYIKMGIQKVDMVVMAIPKHSLNITIFTKINISNCPVCGKGYLICNYFQEIKYAAQCGNFLGT